MVNEKSYTQLMGATLARWALLKFGGEVSEPKIHEWPSQEEIDSWLEEDIDWLNDEEEN
jgi:hypothetical protein